MKTIPNKRTTIEINAGTEGVELLSYAALMKTVMQQPVQGGFSTEEMRKDFRVLDALTDYLNAEVIPLEDSDFAHFKTKLKTMRWGLAHKDLIAFEDDINAL